MGSGITYTSGKIGQAATFPNNCNSCIHMPGPKLQTGSWAAWIKVNGAGSGTSQRIISEGRDTGSIGTDIFVSKEGTTLCWRTHKIGSQTTISLNTWYHVALTFGDNIAKFYLNGTLLTSQSYTENTDYAQSNDRLVLGKMAYNYTNTSNYFPFNGQLNDLRIYDHCLSEEEVAEIAKGLVLHYPLNNNNFGNKNYFKNSHFSNGTTSWSGPNSAQIRIEIKDGHTCITGTKGTNNYITSQTAGPYTANTTIDITISANIYVEETGSFALGNWISSTEVSGWQGLSGTRIWNKTNSFKPGWNRLDCTLKNATNQYNGNIVTGFAYTGTTFWMADPKIEFSSVATPWCPHVDDAEYTAMKVNDSIEHDISGYGNDGTITGTLETTTPNPRYNCTIQFDGSSYILTPSGSFNWYDFSQGTFSTWIKPTATASGWSGTVGIAGDNSQNWKAFGISFYANEFRPVYCNTSYSTISTGKSLPVGEWHFCCATIDGTTVKSYFDGELVKTTTIDWKTATIPTNLQFQVGVDRPGTDEKFTGQYSDIRFYATILTDSQIAQLYKDSMVVDSSGNITPRDLE